MGSFHKSTTTLPKALREEMGLPDAAPRGTDNGSFRGQGGARARGSSRGARGGSVGGGGGRPSVVGRKQARKDQRDGKKAMRVIGRGKSAELGAPKGRTPQHPPRSEPTESKQGNGKGKTKERKSEAEPAQSSAKSDKPKQSKREVKSDSQDEGASSSARPAKKSRTSSAEAESSQAGRRQQKGVSADTMTPLERMLASAEGRLPGSSSGAGATGDAELKKKSRKRMTQAEKDDEDEIAWLESQLGKSAKGKAKEKAQKGMLVEEERDELDELLDDLDRFVPGMYDGSDASDASEEDDDSEDEDDSVDQDDDEDDDDDEDEKDTISSTELGDESSEVFDGDGVSEGEKMSEGENKDAGGLEEEDDDSDSAQSEVAADSAPSLQAASAVAGAGGRYIPPAARAAAAAAAGGAGAESAEQLKLRRQAKGLLNRLGDGNIDSILGEIEALYRSNSRADVSATLTTLILDTISSRSNLVDTFVVLYAAMVAALHKVVGVEFAAYFVQTLTTSLTTHYAALQESVSAAPESTIAGAESEKGKKCLNLLVLLGELYNFQVIACPLVYDLVRLFLGQDSTVSAANDKGMSEVDTELLLKVVKICGAQLRHDDPSALKEIIRLVQERVSRSPAQQLSSRTRFMLETLTNLKNNRAKASMGGDNSAATESIARMKKYLGGMSKKRVVRSHEPLRIGLKDLREADTRGKWWLVGAAWAGHDANGEDGEANGTSSAAKRPMKGGPSAQEDADAQQDELLKLARKQGMNTEARRSVFVVLMSSEDYIDASQRLLEIKLNEVQRREIVRVLLHCLGNERIYNPYYALIGQQLSSDSPSTRVTMQYCLWDFLRALGEREVGGRTLTARKEEDNLQMDLDAGTEIEQRRVANLARAYAWWVAKGALSLAVLKTVNFPALQPRGSHFLQLFFVHLLLSTQTSSPFLSISQTKFSSARDGPFSNSKSSTGTGSGDRKAVETVFVRGTAGNAELARGLLFFLDRNLAKKQLPKLTGTPAESATNERLAWAIGIAKETVGVGASLKGQAAVDDDF